MAHFFPSTTRIGCYLQPRGNDATELTTIPVFRINSTRAPVISSLNSGDPRYRLISYVVSPYSPPYSSIRSYQPTLCGREKQQLENVSIQPMSTLQEVVTQQYVDKVLPPEYGVCVHNEFIHSSPYLRLSKASYETIIHLNRIQSYILCFSDLKELIDEDLDLCQFYESPPAVASRAELHEPGFSAINSRYESLTRYMCGSWLEEQDDMVDAIGFIVSDFQSCLEAKNSNEPKYKQRYTIHRSVCICK